MKKIALIITLFSIILFNSCSVDDLEPTGYLPESMLVTNEESARAVLNQIYSYSRASNSYLAEMTVALNLAGIEQKPATEESKSSFYVNNVQANRGVQIAFYQEAYKAINLVNLFMRTTANGIKGVPEAKTKEIQAEARALRANAYFILLRIFGQFYDSNSIYGVIATTEVIGGYSKFKRSTVAETYKLIIDDLNFAMQYAPESKPRFYVSKVFAEALLAKVYLSKGGKEGYQKAVEHCENVFTKGGERFRLADDYASIFQEKFNSPEVLFAPFHKKKGSERNDIPFSSKRILPSADLRRIADAQDGIMDDGDTKNNSFGYDPRFTFTFKKGNSEDEGADEGEGDLGDEEGEEEGGMGGFSGMPMGDYYNKYPDESAPYYYLRMAEIYLIYAEALVRSNADNQKAIDALNKVRFRAGLEERTYTTFNSKTFLEDVRIEKLLELCIENAEPWFDLVRYDRLGDLEAKNVKSTISNPDKLIFPIPLKAIQSNTEFGAQNPGY